MNIYLNIDFPQDLTVVEMLQQKSIPCFCRVAKDFEIIFQSPLPESVGVVQGWDSALLEERAVAGGGGRYTHYAFAMITLEKFQANVYKINDLSLFYTSFGWCPILINGEYAPPGNFWDNDEEDVGFNKR
ncbi:hypothetical protein [Janthinobacterium lividum]|uniref:Uncharacterized protein n=1 Tax=Janthinobacterium lividum TaxID=29581 RepID=A0ABU0Y5B9_9BURK|nr:hypothetical protein [Janthinobacterium lividum]MDQ4629831.1 hypothetical protein [Janthinobacterium lividum]MDQ4677964.1 hypothetical protein [Janthinobacterium lividum]MDQ4688172.1 hypothetical protein [Janthinobacterium lividum]